MSAPHWKDLLDWIKPEPCSSEEIEWSKKIKPDEYTVYGERLNNMTLEAKEVFIRSGISSMLRSGDLIVGLYTAQGDLITSYCGTYLHAVTGQLGIKYILNKWADIPTVGIHEGDLFYANEALYGGVHNCDQSAIIPVFHEGELVAWTVAAVHQPETGGIDPGGMCVRAQSRYDEGMKIPPMKIGENYQIREDMLEMMENMVGRAPRMQLSDVRARVIAADRIRKRVEDLCHEKGNEFVTGVFRRILIHAEEAARKRIKEWNDGSYRVVVFMDQTGVEPSLIRASLCIRKEDDRLICDFSGTSPENMSPWHAFPHIVAAHAAVYLYAYPFQDLPVSSGTFAPIDWVIPEGSIYNPQPNAAVSCSPTICNSVFVSIPICLSKMMFDSRQKNQVAAATSSGGPFPMFSGPNQRGANITEIITFTVNSAGHGARTNRDGVNTYGFPWGHSGRFPDAEEFENENQVLIVAQGHAPDSCGIGKYRGGAGGGMIWTTYHVPFSGVMSMGAGNSKIYCGQGLFGGYPPPVQPIVRVSDSNLLELMEKGDKMIPTSPQELVSKRTIEGEYSITGSSVPPFLQKQGDVFAQTMTGGPGYGDVLERDPDLVMEDLKDGIISEWTAANVCHVVYEPESFIPDYEKTEKARQNTYVERIKKGIPYTEFEIEWLKKKPPEEILSWYGSWPDAEKTQDIMRL